MSISLWEKMDAEIYHVKHTIQIQTIGESS